MQSRYLKDSQGLHSELLFHETRLKKDPHDHATWSLKGYTLRDLAKTTNDDTYLKKAMEAFEKAMDLSPNQLWYVCDHARLAMCLDESDIVRKDLAFLKRSEPDLCKQDIINRFYVDETMSVLVDYLLRS